MLALLLSGGLVDAVPAGGQAAARTIPAAHRQMTSRQLLALAERARASGERQIAESAYVALSGDPDADVRAAALFGHAMLLSRVDQHAKAATLLRRLLDERPGATRARLELAGILVHLGDERAAARELRSVSAGKLPPDVARLVERWSEALRARKPWGFSLEFALAPDSNINRATRSDGLDTVLGEFDIVEEAKATSGVGVALRGRAYRRVALNDDFKLLAQLTTSADLYRKSDFNLVSAEASIGPEFTAADIRFHADVGVGQSWFGGKPLARSFRFSTSARRSFGARTAVSVRGTVAKIDHRINPLLSGRQASLSLSAERALSSRNGVVASGAIDRFKARDAGYSTASWRAGLQFWQDIGRTTVFAGIESGRLEGDERLALLPEARKDRLSRLSVGGVFRSLTFRGLAPFVRLSREKNRSNVAFYDYARTRTEFGFNRAF